MKSMTGYGAKKYTDTALDISVEVYAVNKKNLEVHCSLPKEWQELERTLISLVQSFVQRGKIHLSVYVKVPTESGGSLLETLNVEKIQKTAEDMRKAAQMLNIEASFTLYELVKMTHLTFSKSSQAVFSSVEDKKELVIGLVTDALRDFDTMRATEGQVLIQAIKENLLSIHHNLEHIIMHAQDVLPRYRKNLLDRLAQAGLSLDLNDERILKEIALFADKCSIDEEITRIRSHLNQFQILLSQPSNIGRTLDFLCQELNREINTIGSKANHIEITKLVIHSKNELEKIREQVQNIE